MERYKSEMNSYIPIIRKMNKKDKKTKKEDTEDDVLEKEEIVDYQICSLNELSGMIQDIKIKNFLS